MIGDLCETQTAECGVSRKRVIGVGFLLKLLARGENRLFSPEKSGRFVFADPAFALSAKRTAYKYKSFVCGKSRLKSKKKSRLAAGDAPEQVASLSVFGDYQKLLVIFYT